MDKDDQPLGNRVRRVFTFGVGQPHFPGYVVVYGVTAGECREKMHRAFGVRWSMEYRTEAEARLSPN